MNSFTGSGSHRPQSSSSSSSSFDSYQFDFGIASRISSSSSSSRPLKDQKLNPNPNPNSPSPKPTAPSAAPSPPARPSWTPNPSPSPSMAGDIFGRTWSSSPSSKLGIPDKNPNLFADLLGPAIGSARASTQNIPLKSAPPPNIPSFSMADLKSSIPNPMKSADPFGSLKGFASNAPTAIKPQKQDDPLNVFFSPSSASMATVETQPMHEMDDWDVSEGFGGEGSGGATTELEGLPPPPVGVTASAARVRGLDNYKQGQFADAIKWLSWAFVLLEKSGGVADEVLICRASCYKEVGEYKKAIADCSKVLDHDSTNVSVLLQRALLYESSEKYRLGAEDLRAVLKIDPGNRLARSTIHRMNQFAD